MADEIKTPNPPEDVAESKPTIQDLSEGEEKFSRVFQHAPILMTLSRLEDGTYVDVNENFLVVSGYSREEVIGRTSIELGWMTAAERGRLTEILRDGGRISAVELALRTKGGRRVQCLCDCELITINGQQWLLSIALDISERKRFDEERETMLVLLRLLNDPGDAHKLIRTVTVFLQKWSGCEEVRIRLRQGADFPYNETRGFPSEFVLAECQMCLGDASQELAPDSRGSPTLECMCGNVLRGRFDPRLPFFTKNGSFWTNSTSTLLASKTKGDHLPRMLNPSHGERYESVALIPLQNAGWTLGLIQFYDRPKGRFTPELIAFLERAAGSIAPALVQRWTQEALQASEERYRLISENTGDVIWLLDVASRRFVYVSPSVQRLRGYSREEVMSRPLQYAVTPDYYALIDRNLASRVAAFEAGDETARIQTHQVEQPCKDGSFVQTEVVTTLLADDQRRVREILGVTRNITERKRAEEAVRKLSRAVEQSPVSVVITDRNGDIEYVNAKFTQLTGYTLEEVRGQNPRLLKSGKTPDHIYPQLWATIATGGEWRGEFLNKKKSGELYWEHASISPICDESGHITHFLAVKEDITDLKKLEEQLRMAQKMEAVGQLAGGVAHDFNNFLVSLLMHLSLLQHEASLAPKVKSSLEELEGEAKLAMGLTRQLLTFSRRQVMQAKPLDINKVLVDSLRMLRRVLGENIDLLFQSGTAPMCIEADPGMMHQVVINLCLNARDAMPHGGRLTIGTRLIEMDDAAAGANRESRPGRFVCLSVADTGCGMDETILSHLFEPFFTTKEVGKGTGLGLATVYGIVKQHQGWIEVQSQVGAGSTFHVYYPALADQGAAQTDSIELRACGGNETILLVEDDGLLRRAVSELLQRYGYQVLEAANGQEAIHRWQEYGGVVDLLFTDVVMPEGMTGLELSERLRQKEAKLKVIISSGYSLEAAKLGMLKAKGITYLAKPYDSNILALAVRKTLDQAANFTN